MSSFHYFLDDYIYYIYSFLFIIATIAAFKIYIYTRNYCHNNYGTLKSKEFNYYKPIRMWPMLPVEYKLSIDEINKLQLNYKNEKLKEFKSDGNPKVQSTVVKKC